MTQRQDALRTIAASERSTDHGFVVVSTLLFMASVWATVAWSRSMSAMAEMTMPGGWTMSMMWMRQPGQTWPGAAASFAGMWGVMMIAMMMPSAVWTLGRYRRIIRRRSEERVELLAAVFAGGYLFVWTVFGIVIFPLGVALATAVMTHPALARAVPVAIGVVVVTGSSLQFTQWKARHLACCRERPDWDRTPANLHTAWQHGLRLGLDCSYCSAGLTAILLAVGAMSRLTMIVVGIALTAERITTGERVARAIGALGIGAGMLLIAQAVGLV